MTKPTTPQAMPIMPSSFVRGGADDEDDHDLMDHLLLATPAGVQDDDIEQPEEEEQEEQEKPQKPLYHLTKHRTNVARQFLVGLGIMFLMGSLFLAGDNSQHDMDDSLASGTVEQMGEQENTKTGVAVKEWIPIKAFEKWQTYHSVDALRSIAEQPSSNDYGERKFVLGYYSCPDEVGNLIHEFTVSLLIAIVTNRTLLWAFNPLHDNKKDDCDHFLRTADWIPRYRDWSRPYNLPAPKVVEPNNWLRNPPSGNSTRHVPLEESQDTAAHPLINPNRVYHTSKDPEFWNSGDVLLTQDFSFQFLSQLFGFEHSEYAAEMIPQLYADGSSFLFGMLFNKSMTFTSEVLDSVRPYMEDADQRGRIPLSIGIHSRHIRPENDGSDVQEEVDCLDLTLAALEKQQGKTPGDSCKVFIMSDRVATIENLSLAARERNCEPIVVENEVVQVDAAEEDGKMSNKLQSEHGPFRGLGFFRDWLVASQATSAFVHFKDRSSSQIVYERMVYDSMTKGIADVPVTRCEIDWRNEGKLRLIEYGQT